MDPEQIAFWIFAVSLMADARNRHSGHDNLTAGRDYLRYVLVYGRDFDRIYGARPTLPAGHDCPVDARLILGGGRHQPIGDAPVPIYGFASE